jgi:hypothetical protein
MFRYWLFRCLSFVFGLISMYLLYLSTFDVSYDNAMLLLAGLFFLLYGIRPSLVLRIFKINPDEEVIKEAKKDLQISVDSWRNKKDR